MKQEKLNLINKIFNGQTIRTVWDSEKEDYYFNVVDVVDILTNSKDPSHYWRTLKARMMNEGNETVTNCDTFKFKAKDGKLRKADVLDTEGIFRLIESIPSPKAEPFKLWLAKLGHQKIDEVFDPSKGIDEMINFYLSKGYTLEWIEKRIKAIINRKKLTKTWHDNGITENVEYALLTNEIYKEWAGMSAQEYKKYKGIRKENLRDNMTDIEVALTDLGEIATRELAKKRKPKNLKQNKEVAKMGGHVAKVAREDIEKNLGESVVTKNNNLNYKYNDQNLLKK